MTNPKIFTPSPSPSPSPTATQPLWLQERGTRDPNTNTLRFTRTYTNAASTDIRETFARAQLQLHIDRHEDGKPSVINKNFDALIDRHEKDQLVIDFSNGI
jgi:excinuclease UvrABC helicase subunit UvrB